MNGPEKHLGVPVPDHIRDSSQRCCAPGCLTDAHTRGWCEMHYTRWRRHGDPLATRYPTTTNPQSAFRHYMSWPPPVHGCWLWRGSITKRGFGIFSIAGKRYGAHRVAYEMFHGCSLAGEHLRHVCTGGRACVQPAHLLLGGWVRRPGQAVTE